ncbi:MAG: gamma-glutamyltransferase, partial [Candidatus Rokuibacteriota bacterium]
MVTSPHALASQAGVAVLQARGSAVDAAIATAAVLSVVYPHMTGPGGDAFWLIYDAAGRRVHALNG